MKVFALEILRPIAQDTRHIFRERDIQKTYFHLPESEPYDPMRGEVAAGWGAEVDGWIALLPGTLVTIHGINKRRFKVRESHFHVGQPSEAEGMHIYLDEYSA